MSLSSYMDITEADLYLLGKGEWHKSYEKLGAHRCCQSGVEGYVFALWAPDVARVSVVGEFNNWNPEANILTKTKTGDVWQGFVPEACEGQLYKYVIDTSEGERLYKADPYAFYTECPPGTASRIWDVSGYRWQDGSWLDERSKSDHMKKPLNIYEVHLGSWDRHDDGAVTDPSYQDKQGSYLTYTELSESLVDYVADMGYTHIELLPIMEHPFDGSWGYQITSYYAPTSRYGNPTQFMEFIDRCHARGIGVILDWVPGGFCRDEHGLVRFNGHKLYEDVEHPNWGTFEFDMGCPQVQNFLISNVLWWLGVYHADGIRVDGVTSMLYLNFGIEDQSQKVFNKNGGEEDLEAIEFIQKMNTCVGTYYPDVMMIAEESSAWPLVTYPPEEGGLGFHYKWDMGWMNDTLHYMQTDFPWRPKNHNLLTFSMMYAFNENFVLPLSHDEVVHGKCSLIGRMPGDYWRQFAGMRSLAFYQITHPGAKLNFMGNEIAQFIEWRYYEAIQWFLPKNYEAHRQYQSYVASLNAAYKNLPALWENSYSWDGFQWIDADDAQQSIISFIRKGTDKRDDLHILINFDPRTYQEFRLGVEIPGVYEEVFNSDAEEFGGSGVVNPDPIRSEDIGWCGQDQSVVIKVPPLAGLILKCTKAFKPQDTKMSKSGDTSLVVEDKKDRAHQCKKKCIAQGKAKDNNLAPAQQKRKIRKVRGVKKTSGVHKTKAKNRKQVS